MLPITRATVDQFCRACLLELDKCPKDTQHLLKADTQLMRIIETLANDNNPIKLSMSKHLCHSCYTKVNMFGKFAELCVCSRVALQELLTKPQELGKKDKLKLICITCFKMNTEKSNSLNLLNSTDLNDLMRVIFVGQGKSGSNENRLSPDDICKACFQKCRTFVEFQRKLQDSHQYLLSILSNVEELTVPVPELSTEYTKVSKQINERIEQDNLEYDSEPEIDNILLNASRNKDDSFELSHFNSEETVQSLGKGKKINPRCGECNRTFRSFSSYEAHRCRNPLNVVPEETGEEFNCRICRKDYKSEAKLSVHINRVHREADIKCTFCQRVFKQKHHLNDHIKMVHEGLRPYKCSVCDRSFGLPKTLRIHLMGHTNERPFECEICHKTFRQKTQLNRHQVNHSTELIVRCPICSVGKASQEELDEHLNRHISKDGFQCSKCGRKFTKKCHLKEHDDAVHLKLRPFKCTHVNCGKAFAARKTLQMHEQTHTGDCANICNVCSKEFNSRANLLRHYRSHKDPVVKKEIEIEELII